MKLTPEKLTLPDPRRDHIQGPLNAPLALLEYGDYECPACGKAHPVVKAIQEELGDQVSFAFRNFPLTNIHPHAMHAAEAAEAAGAQGKFWEMHDLLFENQAALDDQSLLSYADYLELDLNRFINDLDSDVYGERVRHDFKAGIRAGVNGTPTFFINGDRFEGLHDYESLMAALTEHVA